MVIMSGCSSVTRSFNSSCLFVMSLSLYLSNKPDIKIEEGEHIKGRAQVINFIMRSVSFSTYFFT